MNLDRNGVLALVAKHLSQDEIRRSLIFWDRRMLKKHQSVGPAAPSVVAPFDCTVVFADLAPNANWSHPARYIFIDPDTGRCAIEAAAFPPYLDDPPQTYLLLARYGELSQEESELRSAVGCPEEVTPVKLPSSIRANITHSVVQALRADGVEATANAHLYEEILEPGTVLRGLTEAVEVETRSAVVLVDHYPRYNWAHPCEWHLHDADNGSRYRTVKAHFPPHLLMSDASRTVAIHQAVAQLDTAQARKSRGEPLEAVRNVLLNHTGERFAILFSGASNNRHVNDMEFLYRTLVDVYGFATANILVLNHDGTLNYNLGPKPIGNWPGDQTAYRMTMTGAGTRAGLQGALNTVAARIKEGDLLFIHTNNHGAGPGDGVNDYCLCAYNANGWGAYYVNDFVADLKTLPVFDTLIVMMEQCRSGGFITPVVNNSPAHRTHMCTAVQASDYSLAGANFDPFAEDWIAGVNGHYPDGTGLTRAVDTNVDGRISAAEAYAYADAVHHAGDSPRSAESSPAIGTHIFLGLPAHDLFLRDNLKDHGEEPLVAGGISVSPDIIVYNQELLDPQATLCAPAVRDVDTLGEPVEAGQANYVYLRPQNRGTEATSGTAKVFWSAVSTLPTPSSWHLIGSIDIPAVPPGEMQAVGPIPWTDIPPVGHYCFVGLIGSGSDPMPDPASIKTIDDYYEFIRRSNNATWKNFNVQDVFKNSITSLEFKIQGWPGRELSADLLVDLASLPPGFSARLRILRRISEAAIPDGLTLVQESQLWRRYEVTPGKAAALRSLHLEPSEATQALLEITIPVDAREGSYRISVSEEVSGKELGRVTQLLAVGEHAFLANQRSLEVHVPTCVWASRVSPRHRLAFADIQRALRHGYNGCAYCLPEYSTD